MANEQRGEVELKLGDETYTMRPTFEALCAIEGRLGVDIMKIARRLGQDGSIGIREAAVIIFETASASGKKVSEQDIGAGIIQVGLFTVIPSIVKLLVPALSGPSEGNAPAPSDEPNG